MTRLTSYVPLAPAFYARPAATVARELIGCLLVHNSVVMRITETEAYTGPEDTACHASSGKTARNAAMFAPPGALYVYLCYGIHHLVNISTDAEDIGAAVLLRACEPIEGVDEIRRRRGDHKGANLLAGPGRVGQALGVDTSWCFHDVTVDGGVFVAEGEKPRGLLHGARVGIDYAAPKDRDALLRFASADSLFVSHPSGLSPADPYSDT